MTDHVVDKSESGRVWLVGAGPGDPGLITVRGAQLLAEADLVLYDGLVNPLLLKLAKGNCERTARVRRAGHSIVPQEEINQRLIDAARAGQRVVRLKGGDPYIFGRGSEEAAALSAAGIPFEVVPGVTAATAAGEYAGFSYTHREISSAVAFITGHEDPTREGSRLDFQALARFPGTLVFYMGLSRLEELCERLIHAGMDESTPAAVICHATLSTQQVAEGTLKSLPHLVRGNGMTPPSLIVVGECVRQRSLLCWFEKLPLFGVSIAITRPEDQADEVAEDVVRLGGEAILVPMIEIAPVGPSQSIFIADCMQRLSEFDWIVWTSGNGVSEFFRHLRLAGRDARALGGLKLACIGTSTASRLEQFGLSADLVPSQFRAESLGEAMRPLVQGRRVLWAKASRGRPVLPAILESAGATVEQLVVYENRDVSAFSDDIAERFRRGLISWVSLSSPSIARRFAALLNHAGIAPAELRTRIATISPVTTTAAEECGLQVSAEASMHTMSGILAAIQEQSGSR